MPLETYVSPKIQPFKGMTEKTLFQKYLKNPATLLFFVNHSVYVYGYPLSCIALVFNIKIYVLSYRKVVQF